MIDCIFKVFTYQAKDRMGIRQLHIEGVSSAIYFPSNPPRSML